MHRGWSANSAQHSHWSTTETHMVGLVVQIIQRGGRGLRVQEYVRNSSIWFCTHSLIRIAPQLWLVKTTEPRHVPLIAKVLAFPAKKHVVLRVYYNCTKNNWHSLGIQAMKKHIQTSTRCAERCASWFGQMKQPLISRSWTRVQGLRGSNSRKMVICVKGMRI